MAGKTQEVDWVSIPLFPPNPGNSKNLVTIHQAFLLCLMKLVLLGGGWLGKKSIMTSIPQSLSTLFSRQDLSLRLQGGKVKVQ